MKTSAAIMGLAMAGAGCAAHPVREISDREGSSPPPAPQKINWAAVDQSTARTKDRQTRPPSGTTTVTDQVEQGFLPMSEEEYNASLASATDEVKKANSKLTDSEVEAEAIKRADQAKGEYEKAFRIRASTTVKWSSSAPPTAGGER